MPSFPKELGRPPRIRGSSAAPETADQGRRAVRFAGIPALVRGGRRYSGSWDPVPVLVTEGGEQKPMSEAKSEEQ